MTRVFFIKRRKEGSGGILPQLSNNQVEDLWRKVSSRDSKSKNFKGTKREYLSNTFKLMKYFNGPGRPGGPRTERSEGSGRLSGGQPGSDDDAATVDEGNEGVEFEEEPELPPVPKTFEELKERGRWHPQFLREPRPAPALPLPKDTERVVFPLKYVGVSDEAYKKQLEDAYKEGHPQEEGESDAKYQERVQTKIKPGIVTNPFIQEVTTFEESEETFRDLEDTELAVKNRVAWVLNNVSLSDFTEEDFETEFDKYSETIEAFQDVTATKNFFLAAPFKHLAAMGEQGLGERTSYAQLLYKLERNTLGKEGVWNKDNKLTFEAAFVSELCFVKEFLEKEPVSIVGEGVAEGEFSFGLPPNQLPYFLLGKLFSTELGNERIDFETPNYLVELKGNLTSTDWEKGAVPDNQVDLNKIAHLYLTSEVTGKKATIAFLGYNGNTDLVARETENYGKDAIDYITTLDLSEFKKNITDQRIKLLAELPKLEETLEKLEKKLEEEPMTTRQKKETLKQKKDTSERKLKFQEIIQNIERVQVNLQIIKQKFQKFKKGSTAQYKYTTEDKLVIETFKGLLKLNTGAKPAAKSGGKGFLVSLDIAKKNPITGKPICRLAWANSRVFGEEPTLESISEAYSSGNIRPKIPLPKKKTTEPTRDQELLFYQKEREQEAEIEKRRKRREAALLRESATVPKGYDIRDTLPLTATVDDWAANFRASAEKEITVPDVEGLITSFSGTSKTGKKEVIQRIIDAALLEPEEKGVLEGTLSELDTPKDFRQFLYNNRKLLFPRKAAQGELRRHGVIQGRK